MGEARRALLLCTPFLAYAGGMLAARALRTKDAALVVAVVGLAFAGGRTRALLGALYPFALTGAAYRSLGPLLGAAVTASRVHVCDLRAFDRALFGVSVGGERITLHDWFRDHPSPVLDVLCAVPYGTFLGVCIGFAVWLGLRDRRQMVHFGWCWFALNLAGFVTYYVFPAAPPWYYHAHGCQVDALAHASEGAALARVDGWLGVPFFGHLYGQASETFGAMPSLHVGYAVLIALEAWPVCRRAGRATAIGYATWTSFAAVYLDHHWVSDVLAGALYAGAVVAMARVAVRARAQLEARRYEAA